MSGGEQKKHSANSKCVKREKFINGGSSTGVGEMDIVIRVSVGGAAHSGSKTTNIKNLMWRKIYGFEIQILCDFLLWLVELLARW